jgi:hypothetical protein
MGTGGDPFYCYTIDQVAGGAKAKPEPGHFIKVGRVHELEKWEQVDTNDDHSGVKGLHCGKLYCRLAA